MHWLVLPFKIANFESQCLTHFKTNFNAISQVHYNGHGPINY